jgi:hypothetical protein
MITKEGKIEKTKPGSTTIYYVVDNEDGSGFYIEKIKTRLRRGKRTKTRLHHPVGAYGTRLRHPVGAMEPDLPSCRRLWNPTLPSRRRLWNPTPPTQMFLVILRLHHYVDADDDVDTWRNNVLTRFIMLLRLILWLSCGCPRLILRLPYG